MFEHSTLAVPPALGRMSTFSNLKFLHGVADEQWIPTATLYLLVPLIFDQVMSSIGRREVSHP